MSAESVDAERFTLYVENAYEDGHEESRTVTITAPAFPAGDDEAEAAWWEKYAWPETGTDTSRAAQGSCYTVTILSALDPLAVGATNEWVSG